MDNRSSTDQPEQPEWLKANPDSLTAVISDNTHSADALDLQILHALQVNGRVGFGLLGRVLGVSDQTVARRYARMRSASGLRVAAAGGRAPAGAQAVVRARAHHPRRRDGNRPSHRPPPRHLLGALGLRRHRDRVLAACRHRRRRARTAAREAAAHLPRAGRERPKRAARSHSQRSPTASTGRCPDHDPTARVALRQLPHAGLRHRERSARAHHAPGRARSGPADRSAPGRTHPGRAAGRRCWPPTPRSPSPPPPPGARACTPAS